MVRALLAFASCAALAACAVGMPSIPMGRFVSGDIGAVAAAMERELVDGDIENEALVRNVLGQCDLMRGDTEAARRQFGAAGRIMGSWSTSGSEEFAAIVGSEGSKTYKGDPYERSMNAFYLALTFLWGGEPDNARAALKRGILADAEVGDERFQADNPMLFWLAGRMSLLMGLSEDAAGFFKEASDANAFALEHGSAGDTDRVVFGQPARGNLVLLFECGLGPRKVAVGGQSELARFQAVAHPAHSARVWIDGAVVGQSTVIADIDYQARTLGGTEMEGIRRGKAVFRATSLISGQALLHVASRQRGDVARTTAIVGGGLLLAGLFTSTAADTRHWPTLPSTVQALCADVAPGPHSLVIEFLDASGRALAELRQEWSIEVPADGESYYLFRSLPGLDRVKVS